MRLEGWNHIPEGYSATFDVSSAPLWLRVWFRTPFVDRFAYPVMVKRGFGYLRRDDSWHENPAPMSGGWKLREPGYIAPGSYTAYRPVDEADR
jgi:hypothetical protein